MKKLTFDTLYRSGLFLLFVLLGWTLWAGAQTSNPIVRIVEPKADLLVNEHTNVPILIVVDPSAPPVKKIEIVENNTVLAVLSNTPYRYTRGDIPRGSYALSARAIFQDGTTNLSPTVELRVHNALLTFGLDQIDVLRPTLLHVPLWQYVASLLYVFLAFYISKLLDYLIRVWLKKWAEKTDTRFDDLVIELLHGPVKVVSFVIFLYFGLIVFPWPVWLATFLDKCFKIIVALSLTYTGLKAVDMLMNYWRETAADKEDQAIDQHLFPIVSKSLKVFVVIVAVLVTSQNLGLNITAVITSLSISGLALGLAAQDTLANFFGAVVVFVDKPFRIGDRIKLPDVDGIVETIGLRSTRVRNLDGHLITVPNKTMGNATITNISQRPNIKTEINLGLTYDTSIEKLNRALAILRDIYKGHPMTHDVLITFNKFADSALNIQVVHWWKNTDYNAYLAGMQEMNLAVKQRFEQEGISMAFPSRTVYLKQDSEWRLAGDNRAKS